MNYQGFLEDLKNLLTQSGHRLLEFLPNLLGAVVIFVIGLLVARLVRNLTSRLVDKVDRVIPHRKTRNRVRESISEKPISRIISSILYWVLVFFFLAAATETLGLPVITTWLSGITGYLPRLLLAFLIGLVGVVAGVILRDVITAAATSARILYANLLGRLVQIAVVVVTVLISIEQIGVDVSLLTSLIVVVIGALLFGAALAFGLGAGTSVSNILGSYYLQKTYKTGDLVQMGDLKGRISEITPNAVILDSTDGQVLVPAKMFSEVASIHIQQED